MHGHGEKLTRRQERAIAAMLTEPTQEAAAKAVGVDPSTLCRWKKKPDFKKAFRKACRQIAAEASADLQKATQQAVSTLIRNLDSESPSAQVRAAVAILVQAQRAAEWLDFEDRIRSVEDSVQELFENKEDQV